MGSGAHLNPWAYRADPDKTPIAVNQPHTEEIAESKLYLIAKNSFLHVTLH